jgi:hypothetical protein
MVKATYDALPEYRVNGHELSGTLLCVYEVVARVNVVLECDRFSSVGIEAVF